MNSPKADRANSGQRRGAAHVWALALLGAVAAVGSTAGGYYFWRDRSDEETAALVHEVGRGHFEYYVSDRGDVQSSSNVEIRCHVKARGSQGTQILKIFPEGSYVKKGDFLVQFDDSLLREELTLQEIVVANGEAAVIQANSDLQTATTALEEYAKGTYKQDLELAGSEVFVAEENLRRASEYLQYSQRLAGKGYVTAVQLEADRFAVEKANKELQASQTKLSVLKNFTRKKTIGQLTADIAKGKAVLKSANNTHKLNVQKRDEVLDQIAKCRVVAPKAGQVVYENQNNRHRSNDEFVVEEGALVREGQTIIRLPDPKSMHVNAVVNETRINLVKPGQAAQIELVSKPGELFQGLVLQVDAFPIADRWNRHAPKKYNVQVQMRDPPSDIKPGLRANVRILVHQEDEALTVPLQSVVSRPDGTSYCLIRDGDGWSPTQVSVGPNNEQFAVIRDGLASGDSVAINPRRFLDQVELPELPAEDSKVTRQKLGRRQARRPKGKPGASPRSGGGG